MKWLLRLLGIRDDGTSKNARVVLRISLIFFIALLAFANWKEIDRTITSGGKVIPSDKTQRVQAADGGILMEMRVKEGDKVQKGQVVAVLEKGRADASYQEAKAKVGALTLTNARLEAEMTGRAFHIDPQLAAEHPELADVQRSLYNQRLKTLTDQLNDLNRGLALAEKEISMNRPLVKSGDVSEAEVIRMERAANDIRVQITNVKSKYRQDAYAEQTKVNEELNTQKQTLADRTEVLSHTDLVAPETGIVNNIKVTTLGGVLRAGDEVMEILPEGKLVVEAEVAPADMTTIVMGMPARVKLDAYDYSIFGALEGKVIYISQDTIQREPAQMRQGQTPTYYRVHVETEGAQLKTQKGEEITVRPGMTAQVDLLGDKRTIWQYITKPITKTLSESLSKK